VSGAVERRFDALAVAEREPLVALAERVLDEVDDVTLLSVPGPATMLVELTESVGGQPYHLCEVVVSEASVAVRGCRGDAVVLGADPERALAAAICDAAAEAGLFAGEIEALVAAALAARATARVRRAGAVAATRVDLEVLG
jgi:alpha-D-ribose 1-methylphosphonate 5-triphosphate synthase subunit PhnG